MQYPKSTAQIIAELVHGAKHSDNLSEFVQACLAPAWKLAGLPGQLPLDTDGFIDTPDPIDQPEEWAELIKGHDFGVLGDVDLVSSSYSIERAIFVTFETSYDPGSVADAAKAAGLEAYEFRHEVVVVLPATKVRYRDGW